MMKVQEIDINLIITNPGQPRRSFDDKNIEELAQSIKENGLIQPIVVRPNNDGYMVIAGERRFRALKLLEAKKIPAIVVQASENESENLSLIENIQRMDLSPMEEALAYQSLLENQNITQEELAKKIGKSQSSIANKMRLLQLIPEVKEAIGNMQITERHGRSLLGLDSNNQLAMLRKIIAENLTVAQVEQLVNKDITQKVTIRKNIISRSSKVQLAVNTINEALDRVKNAGIEFSKNEEESDDYYQMIVRIKK